jgi:methyl-accepting chemotaxis protein
MPLTIPRISIKWKIFLWCFALALAIVLFNFWYATQLVRKSAGRSSHELQGHFDRYQSFQRAYAHYLSAAASVWATAPQLRAVFAKGDDEAARPVLAQIQQSLAQNVRPSFIVLVDRHGCFTTGGDTDSGAARGLRPIADLRQGMTIRNALLEHDGHAYLLAGEPVVSGGDTVGGVLLGVRLERIFGEYKQQTDDDPKKQVELALVHNQRTTASAAHADDWDDIARATRAEAREVVQEGGDRVSVVELPDGPHDFFQAQLNGYDGATQGSVGNLFVLRNRVDRANKINSLIRDTLIVAAFALALAAAVAFAISVIVTRPLRQFIAATQDLAHGSGDLTRRLDVHARAGAEMHQLADNLNQLFGKLQTLASEVQGASFQVGASSAEISAASKQMLGGAKDQAARIESSTAAVTELSSSIQTVAENAMQATKVTKESGDTLASGIKQLGETARIIEDTAGKIQELGQSGKRIGTIVEVIRQISEQTSLLALNASIEAAHAGEQGRGFAVVADEVSQLAKRVGQSAKDIEALIGTITEQTAEAVHSMQQVTRMFGDQVRGAAQMQESLQQIIAVTQDTARSVQEQAVVSDEIARNMDAVQKIAQEVLGSSEEAVVQGEQLHALALKLEELVHGFRIERGPHDGGGGAGDRGGRALPPTGATAATAALPERSTERRRTARG